MLSPSARGRARRRDAHDALGENPSSCAATASPTSRPSKQLPVGQPRWFGTLYARPCPTSSSPTATRSRSATAACSKSCGRPGTRPATAASCCSPTAILFVGDHLLPKITPHVGVYPNGPENPLGDFLASHEKIQRLDARLVCPAHGGVYEDHRHRARQLIDFHRVRKLTMLDLIRRQRAHRLRGGARRVRHLPDNRFQVMAATSETLAHLELLRLSGKVLRTDEAGVVRYQAR